MEVLSSNISMCEAVWQTKGVEQKRLPGHQTHRPWHRHAVAGNRVISKRASRSACGRTLRTTTCPIGRATPTPPGPSAPFRSSTCAGRSAPRKAATRSASPATSGTGGCWMLLPDRGLHGKGPRQLSRQHAMRQGEGPGSCSLGHSRARPHQPPKAVRISNLGAMESGTDIWIPPRTVAFPLLHGISGRMPR